MNKVYPMINPDNEQSVPHDKPHVSKAVMRQLLYEN